MLLAYCSIVGRIDNFNSNNTAKNIYLDYSLIQTVYEGILEGIMDLTWKWHIRDKSNYSYLCNCHTFLEVQVDRRLLASIQ